MKKSINGKEVVELDLRATFEFVSEHPAMALVSGGILCLILAAFLSPVYPSASQMLLNWVPWLIGGGIFLQVLWLFRHDIGRLIS